MAENGETTPPSAPVVANRLLIIGDSLAMGAAEVSGTEVTAFISPAFPDLLRTSFPQLEIILTCGVRYDSNTVRQQLAELLKLHRPAVVLAAVGGSDADVDWRKTILTKGRRTRSRVSLETYEQNLRATVDIARAAGSLPILVEVTSTNIEMRGIYLTRISGVDVNEIVVAGGGQQTSDLRVESYRHVVRRIAAELAVDLVPSPPALESEDPHVIFTIDGVHLGVIAQRLLAAEFSKSVRRAFGLHDDAAVA